MIWLAVIATLLSLVLLGPVYAFFVAILTFGYAVLKRMGRPKREVIQVRNGADDFARINKFDEERSIGKAEYLELIDDLEGLVEEGEARIAASRAGREASAETIRNLADDLRWACDEIDDLRLTFRRTLDRNAYRDLMIRARLCGAVLYAATEEGRALAEFDTRVLPLKGRFQMKYENAHGDASQWEISALGLSTIGANRYLWLYSDKVKGVRQFRLDRILSISDVKSGERVEGAAVPDWLADRVGPEWK